MTKQFTCWKCNTALVDVILPMSRREECAKCGADQHVCETCTFYINGRCDEDRAEQVSDTQRANFCDYFKPSVNNRANHTANNSCSAKVQLAALFGHPEPESEPGSEQSTKQLTPAELAEKKLRALLNG